jgi:predicted transcriptional regulator
MRTPSQVVNFVSNSSIRSTLLGLLVNGPKTPTELAFIQHKHVSHVSRALGELRERGLVEQLSTASRERYYRATGQGMSIYMTLLRAK